MASQEGSNPIRNDRREQILRAALQVFSRKGIIETKMSMVAEKARISKGLLYNYFTSKDELFTTLVEWALSESHRTMTYAYKLPGKPIEKIRILTEMILDEGDGTYFMLIHQARTSDETPEKVKELLKQYSMNTYVDELLPIFLEGQQAGEIIDIEPRKLIAGYLSVISGLMLLGIPEDGHSQQPDADLILRMIASNQ